MYYSNSPAANCYNKTMKHFLSSFRSSVPGWAVNVCGLTGAALFLAGVVCFFAYNWQQMGAVLKLGLPLLGLLACAYGAYRKGLQTGAGQVFCVACGLFIGIFWAVYGQVYQTGAFVYEFCFAWFLCLLPLALLAGNRWLWLLWVGVGNAYLCARYGAESGHALFWPAAALNAVCFAAAEREFYKTRRFGWYSLFFLFALLGYLFVYALPEEYGAWFWGCLCGILLLGVYACANGRGAAQLGFCAMAVDCLLAERIISDFRSCGAVAVVLAVALLFAVSAWGVYMLARREVRRV